MNPNLVGFKFRSQLHCKLFKGTFWTCIWCHTRYSFHGTHWISNYAYATLCLSQYHSFGYWEKKFNHWVEIQIHVTFEFVKIRWYEHNGLWFGCTINEHFNRTQILFSLSDKLLNFMSFHVCHICFEISDQRITLIVCWV